MTPPWITETLTAALLKCRAFSTAKWNTRLYMNSDRFWLLPPNCRTPLLYTYCQLTFQLLHRGSHASCHNAHYHGQREERSKGKNKSPFRLIYSYIILFSIFCMDKWNQHCTITIMSKYTNVIPLQGTDAYMIEGGSPLIKKRLVWVLLKNTFGAVLNNWQRKTLGSYPW
jgi:hypothetical protein